MNPTMYSGDFVLVDTTVNRIGGKGIYCMDDESGPLIQRCQKKETGDIIISNDNHAYGKYTLTRAEAESRKVIGRVRWICRKH